MQIQEAGRADETRVSVSVMPARPVLMGPPNDFGADSDFNDAFIEFCNQSRIRRINLAYPVGGYFTDISKFFEAPSRPQRFYSLDPDGDEEKPGGRYLTAYARGYFDKMNALAKRVKEYAEENALVFAGPAYELFLLDEVSAADTKEYLMQFCALVK
jgi:effector-binding domain-containing protein